MRIPGLAAAAALMMVWGEVPAYAGLLDSGLNTVDAQFYFGAPDAVPVASNAGDFATLEDEGTLPILNPGGAQYSEGASDLSTIGVGDTMITITNDVTGPYCTITSLPCPDVFTGFEFLFSSGVDITGVAVDPSSAADMSPTTLTLLSPTEILVNMSGSNSPNAGDALVLDLTFPPPGGGGGTTGVPEPSSLALLGAGLAGLYLRRSRRKAA